MKLSIITINLNNREGLKKTAKSIVNQTFTDYEWLVIDGGSTDGSVDLIRQYINEISFWVSETDGGIYNAMNKGIQNARGEYLLFLNSGDYLFSSTVLDEAFESIDNEDIVYGLIKKETDGKISDSLAKSEITLLDLWHNRIPHQSSFFNSSLFNRFGLYDETLHIVADWVFYLRAIIFGGCSVKFLPIVISVYEGGGISSKQETEKEIQLVKDRIPAKLYDTMIDAISKQQICRCSFFSSIYAILYRVALVFKGNR